MNASYLALSCLEHVLLLCTTTKRDREFSSAVRAHTISRVLSSSPRFVNNKGGVMAVRACALISCALLQAWTSSLLTWHSLTNHVSLSLLELAAVHAASRLSGLQLHLVQAAWQAVLLHFRSTQSCSALIASSCEMWDPARWSPYRPSPRHYSLGGAGA